MFSTFGKIIRCWDLGIQIEKARECHHFDVTSVTSPQGHACLNNMTNHDSRLPCYQFLHLSHIFYLSQSVPSTHTLSVNLTKITCKESKMCSQSTLIFLTILITFSHSNSHRPPSFSSLFSPMNKHHQRVFFRWSPWGNNLPRSSTCDCRKTATKHPMKWSLLLLLWSLPLLHVL